jgi:signal transduction protein with GAF and PtsI domain
MILNNYVDSLEEENEDLRNELTAAIKEKRVAEQKSEKDRRYAKARLKKLHTEQYLRRQAQDYAAEQEKINKALQETLKKYTDVPQDTKLRLKKEWADEAAAGDGRFGWCS